MRARISLRNRCNQSTCNGNKQNQLKLKDDFPWPAPMALLVLRKAGSWNVEAVWAEIRRKSRTPAGPRTPCKRAPARKITYINEFKLFLPCGIGGGCFLLSACCLPPACLLLPAACCLVIYNVSNQGEPNWAELCGANGVQRSWAEQKLHFHAQFTPIYKVQLQPHTRRMHRKQGIRSKDILFLLKYRVNYGI